MNSRQLELRRRFPSLAGEVIFFENAGGSQVPKVVSDAINDYFHDSYVNLDAGYITSKIATNVVSEAHEFVNTFMNGDGVGKVILGASTTQLCRMLADCYLDVLKPDDEVIVAASGHEANIGPWMRLAKFGIKVKLWQVDKIAMACTLTGLKELLNSNTKIVAFPHVSNLTGEIVDVAAITAEAHKFGAKVVVDGVAYAPHSAMDMKGWGVDWYVYSTYKVYGPHMAALFGTFEALDELTGPMHFFIPKESVPYKFELGSISHEGCAGILGLRKYLNFVTKNRQRVPVTYETVSIAYSVMEYLEGEATESLLSYLNSVKGIRIIGPAKTGPNRVGTVSFVHDTVPNSLIVKACDDAYIGIRSGHMYSYRLCEGVGIDPATGVTRVSLVHYNTVKEVEYLIKTLDTLFRR